MTALHQWLLKFKPYFLFIEWTKVLVLPGFKPLPLYTVGSFFIQEISKESLVNKASSLAYNFLLAIFPAIIFLFTLIPYIPISNFQDQLLSLVAMVLPKNAYLAVQATLIDIVKNQNGKLLSFGFLFALFFATNGVHNLMIAFNKSSLVEESRTWLQQRWVSLQLTFIIAFGLVSGLSIITFTEYFISLLRTEIRLNNYFWILIIDLSRWVILIALYFITISILYRYGPANTKKWKLFSPGSWLATFLAVLTFWGFAFYINNFSTYNKLYGSIGTLIVMMIWMYLNSLIILIGFELNASIELSKRSIKIVKPQYKRFRSDLNLKNQTKE
ncbi:MAG: YihY/virulence factor BrkB family protein [Sphingobacteriaceae bacterium]